MLQQMIGESNGASFWLPERASTVAGGTDGVFNFILWVSVFFFVLITVLLVWFVIKYRHREGRQHESAAGHSMTLELTWTLIPTVLVVIMFYTGFRQFLRISVQPPNAYEITATSRMWNWEFTYPNGITDPELHVPSDRPVRVVLHSQDVIHNLYVPAFRVKMDAVPGRYNRMWFEATKPGTYDLYCGLYCGTQHSVMVSKAVVHTPTDFDQWMAQKVKDLENVDPVVLGKRIYANSGCAGCHSIDGSKLSAPTWKDLYGSPVPLEGGQTVSADESYIRESITKPAAKVHAGFSAIMPAYTFSDKQMNGIIQYMKSISSNTSQTNPGGASVPTPTTGMPTTPGPAGPATQPTSTAPATGPATAPAVAPGGTPNPQ